MAAHNPLCRYLCESGNKNLTYLINSVYLKRFFFSKLKVFMSIFGKKLIQSPVVATALALFAMLFGSGNIALPLGLGRDLGSMAIYAMFGFFLTAVIVPVIGIIGMALYDGDYRQFIERIGVIPGAIIIAICLALMGPFCIIPRCIAISHAALAWMLPSLSLFYFSIAMVIMLFVATQAKNSVVDLMSRFLGPLKLGLLTAVIVKGFFVASQVAPCALSGWNTFGKGLFEGYGTLDLLAVIFFSGLLIANLKKHVHTTLSKREMIRLLVQAGALGALLLGLMYAGFVMVASWQSGAQACAGVGRGQLLSVLASIVLGAGGGILASITIAIACMTTAIALTTVFAEYLSTQSFFGKITLHYKSALMITLVIALFFANYGFEGIQTMLAPIVMILYPALIVLTCTNILYKVWHIDLGVIPFYITLIGMIIIQLGLFV